MRSQLRLVEVVVAFPSHGLIIMHRRQLLGKSNQNLMTVCCDRDRDGGRND